MRRYALSTVIGASFGNLIRQFLIASCLIIVPWSHASAAPLELLPFQDFQCAGDECPLEYSEANDSGTSTEGAYARSRSSGQLAQTNRSQATVGVRFQVCDPATALVEVSGLYQGLLRGTGGGIINRGLVRGYLDFRNLTTDEQLALLETSRHEERGSAFQTDNTIINASDFAIIGLNHTAQTEQELEPGNVYMLGFTLRTEASGTGAEADFNRAEPPRFGRLSNLSIDLTPNMPDTDGDGLYDAWESQGVQDCDDNMMVDLPALGADPEHKDIFIEYDWLPGEQPDKASIDQLKGIFANAPVSNPDGESGIRLWVDTGDLTEFGLQENELPGSCFDNVDNNGDGLIDEEDPLCRVGDDFGGGDVIDMDNVPNGQFLPRLKDDADGDGEADFFQVRAQEYDEDRRAVFHYAISGPKGPGEDPLIGRDSCEDGIDNDGDGLLDGDDDIDCFGGGQGGGGNFFVSNARTSTFLHELGHSLGLGHGGRDVESDDWDSSNCKPNYLSIMNYSFSGGVPSDLDGDSVFESKTLDFSPLMLPDGSRASAPLDPLVEDQLIETVILDESDEIHATRFVNALGIGRTSAVSDSIDWNGVNGIEDGTVTANINRGDEYGDPEDCEEDSAALGHPDDETLVAYGDWPNLRYRFPVRAADDSRGPIIYPEPPISPDDFDEVFFASDLSVEKQVALDPWVAGQSVDYELTVTNHGPNGVPGAELLDTPPEGVSFVQLPEQCTVEADGAVRCLLSPLAVGATETVNLKARLPVIRDCGRAQFATLTNTASVINVRGRELLPENNQVSVRHRVLCPVYEYAAKFVCGTQEVVEDGSLLMGRYGSLINVHNPQSEEVFVFAKLALADASNALVAGEITPIGLISLDYDEAVSAGCDHVRKVAFEGQNEPAILDGYLVFQSARSLDVTGVYTRRAAGDTSGEGSIDVEPVNERKFSPPAPQADLRPAIQGADTRCDEGHCSFAIKYLVENIGDVAAGTFISRAILQPSGTALGIQDWPLGLAAGMSESGPFLSDASAELMVGQEAFCIDVDRPDDAVLEVDETNNIDCFDLPNFNQ